MLKILGRKSLEFSNKEIIPNLHAESERNPSNYTNRSQKKRKEKDNQN